MTAAVVTGAAGGIGRAVAARLGADGHRVVAVDLSADVAGTVVDLERAGVAATAVQVDLTADDGPERVAEAVGEEPLAVLVNNAGITRDARLVNMTDEAFHQVLAVNLGAAHRLATRLRPLLGSGSAIVNIASRAYLGNFGQYNYALSKGGIVGLTRALALDLAPDVRVNAVAPGLIATEMAMGIPEDVRARMVAAIPLDRMGTPEEIAEVVAFLASDRSSYVTGHVLVAGGGRSLS
jgi:NAD(P)-dependent dehydrogenase (short-subunit alcohol dehydrogenase family)